MFGTYSTTTAGRLTLAGVAAVTLLGLAACDPTTGATSAAGSPSSSASPASSAITLPAAPTGSSTGAPASSSTGSGGAGPTTTPVADGVPACTSGQIKVTTKSEGAAMTHRGLVLIFTDTAGTSCSLAGYPGADLPDSAGTPWNATRTSAGYMGGAAANSTPATVVLTSGESASAVLEWDAMPTGGGQLNSADCPGLNSVHLLITPPNTLTATTFPGLQDACQGFQIHPVVSGTTGQG